MVSSEELKTDGLQHVWVHREDWEKVKKLRRGEEDYSDVVHEAVELLEKERKPS